MTSYLIILIAALLNAVCVWHLNFKRKQYRKLWHEMSERYFAMRNERDQWTDTARRMTDAVAVYRGENDRLRSKLAAESVGLNAVTE